MLYKTHFYIKSKICSCPYDLHNNHSFSCRQYEVCVLYKIHLHLFQEHLIKLNSKNDVAHSLLTTGEDMLQSYNCHPFQTVQIRSSLAKLRRSCDAAKKQAKKKKVCTVHCFTFATVGSFSQMNCSLPSTYEFVDTSNK